jgi:hypothetical protein
MKGNVYNVLYARTVENPDKRLPNEMAAQSDRSAFALLVDAMAN